MQMRYTKADTDASMFWSDSGVGYALCGRPIATSCSRSRAWSTTRSRKTAANNPS